MKVMTHLSTKEQMNVGIEDDLARNQQLNTKQLFANVKEVMIEHLNETYILRVTKQNKLILTK